MRLICLYQIVRCRTTAVLFADFVPEIYLNFLVMFLSKKLLGKASDCAVYLFVLASQACHCQTAVHYFKTVVLCMQE